jgi:Putative peptidoglycan binding domain
LAIYHGFKPFLTLMKKISQMFALLVLFFASTASAQSFFPTSLSLYGSQSSAYRGACVSIARDLTTGSRGSDVTALQNFIVSRNYPGGGSWMVTGYFGSATRAGVINFQMDARLPQTGWVDAGTRLAISNMTCGYGVTPPIWNYPTPTYPTYPTYPPAPTCGIYPYYSPCPNTGALSVTYLSPNSGAVGASVTVFGTGFTSTGNSVRFGNGIIAGLNSTDGRSLSFTVPSTLVGYGSQKVTLGTYNVSVTNSYGATSSALPFTVTSLGSYGAPTLTNISGPTSLAINTSGTWTITLSNPSSTYTNVSVEWGDPVYGASATPPVQVYSTTQTLTFTHGYAQTGTYTIRFTATNTQGQSSAITTTVNVTGSSQGSLMLSYLSPTSGRIGTQVQLIGSGFSAYDNTVRFGIGGTQHLPSQNNGTVMYYTIPAYVSACDLIGTLCGAPVSLVSPGTYQISVTNSSGSTAQLSFNVIQ